MSATSTDPGRLTSLLENAGGDRADVLDRAFTKAYQELRGLARCRLRAERADHTLGATALVHEAYIRLNEQRRVDWKNSAHFFAVVSLAMRRILINHAHARRAAKRGGGAANLALDAAVNAAGARPDEALMALHDALERLHEIDPRSADIVVHHCFGGLGWDEIADLFGVSPTTVRRAWRAARAWLRCEISSVSGGPPKT